MLAILSYLVFSRYELKAKPIYLLAFVCATLICVQKFFTKRFPFEISEYLIKPPILMEVGHSASSYRNMLLLPFLRLYFLAIHLENISGFLIFFCFSRLVWQHPFSPYWSLKLFDGVTNFILCERSISIAVIGFLTTFFILYQLRDAFLWLLYWTNKDIFYSAEIILEQMFEPDYYLNFLQFMPGNIKELENTVGIPEVGFTKYSMDFGGIFLFTFLLLLLTRLSHWRPFILLSLFHITIIHVPIIIYVFFLFQSKQNQQ